MLKKELELYRRLSKQSRSLLVTIICFSLAEPLLGIFLDAFLFRLFHDLRFLVCFTATRYIGIIFGFLISKSLRNYFQVQKLYAFFLITLAIGPGVLFFSVTTNPLLILPIGIIHGIFMGAYWANRLELTLQLTKSHERNYFFNLESSWELISSVCTPIALGFFLQASLPDSDTTFSYSQDIAFRYQSSFIIFIAFLLLSSFVILFSKLKPEIKDDRLQSINPKFLGNLMHAWILIKGFIDGTTRLLPVLIMLVVLQGEGTIGLIKSASALCGALLSYLFGRTWNNKNRVKQIVFGIFLLILSAPWMMLSLNVYSTCLIVILFTLSQSLILGASNAILFDGIEQISKNEVEVRNVLCSRELYLNGGRILGMMSLLGASSFGVEFVIRIFPFVIGAFGLILIPLTRRVEKNLA
jgi:MFS transporter, YQGE family, putative transporter